MKRRGDDRGAPAAFVLEKLAGEKDDHVPPLTFANTSKMGVLKGGSTRELLAAKGASVKERPGRLRGSSSKQLGSSSKKLGRDMEGAGLLAKANPRLPGFASSTSRSALRPTINAADRPGPGQYDPGLARDNIRGGDSMFKNKDERFRKGPKRAELGGSSRSENDLQAELSA